MGLREGLRSGVNRAGRAAGRNAGGESPARRFAAGIGAGLAAVALLTGAIVWLLGSGGGHHGSAATAGGAKAAPQVPAHQPGRPSEQAASPSEQAVSPSEQPASPSGQPVNPSGQTAGPSEQAAKLQDCLNHWNSPGNPTQRARFAGATRSAAGSGEVGTGVLVLRYAGRAVRNVGVGVGGVNLHPGDCLIVHPSNVMFGFTDGFWHQVGYGPGTDLAGLPGQAATAPNANVDFASGYVNLAP